MTRMMRGLGAGPALALAIAAAAMPRPARAQDSVRVAAGAIGSLPADVAAEVVRVYNAPATVRARGALTIDASYNAVGDVAVLNGPLTVAGHVTGRVVAINADVLLQPGARIDGDLLVVGGHVDGRTDAVIGGDLRVYGAALPYREEGEQIAVAEEGRAGSADDPSWWRRWNRRRARSRSEITFASAHTYNRVEGLPLQLGPSYRRETDWGQIQVEALGILRTSDRLAWTPENLGHRARAEVRFGGRPGFALGGRLYDVVESVEPWQLSDEEVGLAAFFLHRDYRDYYNRHGASMYARLVGGDIASVTVGLADERWSTRETNDPFTLFRNSQGWRLNPAMDEARFHVATASLKLDSRNTPSRPWSGWYGSVDFEHGTGHDVVLARSLSVPPPSVTPPFSLPTLNYNRAFVDLRRYNRLAPNAQLNVRMVAGGQLGGDDLPLERRLSVGGPGTIPGYDFRSFTGNTDVGQCNDGPNPAAPALCQRVALLQAEYRGDLRYNIGLDDSDRAVRYWRDGGASWVLFADAGRGWLIGDQRDGRLTYKRNQLPDFGSFRTDVGIGFDFADLGLYVAKAVSDTKEPANFLVRVRRRI
jgi:Omp85 superfamily domain